MKKYTRNFFAIILFVFTSHFIYGQDSEVFHGLSLGTEVWKKEKWQLDAIAHWNHLYNEPKWRRFGIDAVIKRNVTNWTLLGGLNTYYTFNTKTDDYFELRTWLGIALKTPVSHRLKLAQKLRGEWRNFFYSGHLKDENYTRLRYKVGFDYELSKNEETHKEWKLLADIEWYFLKDPASGERFVNSGEYSLKLVREFANQNEVGFGYILEEFSSLLNENKNKGHTFFIEYSF